MSIQRCYKTQVWKPGNLLYEGMLEITQYLNVVSLPTQIHNSPTAIGPPPLELSIQVNEKPKLRTRVLAGSVRVFPLTSRTIVITSCVAPSFITKSVVWTKPWTEEQTNRQCVLNIGDRLSKIPGLPANIQFKLEAILSVFQLNSDYCTKVLQGACTVSYWIMKPGCAIIKMLQAWTCRQVNEIRERVAQKRQFYKLPVCTRLSFRL